MAIGWTVLSGDFIGCPLTVASLYVTVPELPSGNNSWCSVDGSSLIHSPVWPIAFAYAAPTGTVTVFVNVEPDGGVTVSLMTHKSPMPF
jgi:hypothetical protein